MILSEQSQSFALEGKEGKNMSKYDVSRFRNVTVALNTPFAPNGDVDLAAARKLTRYYIEKGVRSL